jgi:hypothetical protein
MKRLESTRGAIMMRNTHALVAVAMAIGLVASACSGSNTGTQTTGVTTSTASSTSAAATTTSPATATTTPSGNAQLQSLIPTPANSQQTKGPDGIPDGGIHLHFQVNGSPTDVMDAYKTALEGKGWSVTTIVTSSNGGGGGGATYTGTQGDAYGVFDGGGFASTTYVNVCTWPSKPSNPNCSRG